MNRMFFIFFFICLICHLLRSVYELFKYKGIVKADGKGVFVFMLINMILLWVSWFNMCELDTATLNIPHWIKYSGLLLFITGLSLFFIALIKLKKLEGYTGDLIQDGIFSILRHPMYLGFIFWIIGYSVFLQASSALISSVIWIPNILFWRHMEEKELKKQYDHYEKYRERTIF